MKLKLTLLNLGILALLATGCGKNLNGNYNGSDQYVQNQTQAAGTTTGSIVPSNQQTYSPITMNLTQSGDSVSGSWTDSTYNVSGQIMGSMSGGTLNVVSMTSNPTNTVTPAPVNGAVGYNPYQNCIFTGSLSIGDNNNLSGSLGSSGSNGAMGIVSNCQGVSRTLNLIHQ